MSPLEVNDLHHQHVADVHKIELQIHDLRRSIEELDHRVKELQEWRCSDQERSRWFYENEPTIRDVVENARSLRRVKTWVIGLASVVGGAMLLWQTVVWPIVRDHQR